MKLRAVIAVAFAILILVLSNLAGDTMSYSQIGVKLAQIINAIKTAVNTDAPLQLDVQSVSEVERLLTQIGKMSDKLEEWLSLADGNPHFGKMYAREIEAALLRIYNGNTKTVELLTDGTAGFGGDLDDPAKTSLKVFSSDQTYNGESVGAGDLLIGDNSTGVPNLFYDASLGRLQFRTGSTVVGRAASGDLITGLGAVAYTVTSQSISNTTATALSPLTEYYDDDDLFFATGSPSRITIPYDGRYMFGVKVTWANNATGLRIYGLFKNGDTGTYYSPTNVHAPLSSGVAIGYGVWELPCEADDYFEIGVWQSSGGALNVDAAEIQVRRVK